MIDRKNCWTNILGGQRAKIASPTMTLMDSLDVQLAPKIHTG